MPNTAFQSSHIEIGGNTIYFRRYGKGPAILMVHGFPCTSLMWRHLAPKFADDHTVICVDLRAYGQSGIPKSSADHFPYSKRAMAAELVGVMEKLAIGPRLIHRQQFHHERRYAVTQPYQVGPALQFGAIDRNKRQDLIPIMASISPPIAS